MSSPYDHTALEIEKEWIAMSKKNIDHFANLYRKYYEPIFRFVYRRTDDDMLTADICSQTFLKAMNKLSSYRWTGKPFGAWLFTIANNEIKKHFRDKKEVFVIEQDKLEGAEDFLDDWKFTAQDRLSGLLNTLNELELRLIELKYFEGCTFK